jgi:hypothetical protein
MAEIVSRATDEQDVFLLSKEAAIHLRVSHRTLERWRVEGRGPAFTKLGTGKRARVLYRLRDLNEWLARYRYRATSEYGSREDDGGG